MKASPGWWALTALTGMAMVAGAAAPAADKTAAAAARPTTDDVPSAISSKIRTVLKERYPEIEIEQIHTAPLPGLYEVVLGDQVIYSDAGGAHLMVGRLIDTRTKEDLSGKHWAQYNAIDFSTLPLDSAIKTVKGDGSRKLAVFADPLCPYCKQLEKQMESLTNLTIYTFLFPLESVHPGATARATKIWCAKDPSVAWTNWMLHDAEPETTPSADECKTDVITHNGELAQKLKINSTPTLFFQDGERGKGALQTSQLEEVLQATQQKGAAPGTNAHHS